MSGNTNSARPESRAKNQTQADRSESTDQIRHATLNMKKIDARFLDSNSADVLLVIQVTRLPAHKLILSAA